MSKDMHDDPIGGLVHLWEDGAFNRRELVNRVLKKTGSMTATVAALAAWGVPEVEAQTPVCADVRVPENAPDLTVSNVTFRGVAGTLYGHLAYPKDAAEGLPGVLVIHENRGLTAHIKDVTRRVARQGYVALGVDLISRWGPTDSLTDEQAAAAYRNVTEETAVQDMQAALEYMAGHRLVQADRIGCMGFCAGGTNSWLLAVNTPDLAAAVVFYGFPPTNTELIRNMRPPLLGIYAQLDRNFTGRVPAAVTALNDAQKVYSIHVYEGVNHAFFNDTGARYEPEVACDAWAKVTGFFKRHLYRPRA